MKTKNTNKTITSIRHVEEKRTNIPTAEHQTVLNPDKNTILHSRFSRNRDIDPQVVWRGKDEQDLNDLVVQAPPIFIQEKVHPKFLIDELQRQSKAENNSNKELTNSLFSDFDGMTTEANKTDFYQHDQNWSNRMILGDSLQVMASLAERENIRGKVQCIYFDPPYGIKFNSNFQWSTTSRDVKDGKKEHITREPEMVKAFRDTWRDGIHSYLTYIRDRLTVARDLLTESGSIFVQIGDENVHLVRSIMDEVFGSDNFISQIAFKKNLPLGTSSLPGIYDIILWFARDAKKLKMRKLYEPKPIGLGTGYTWLDDGDGRRRRMTSEERRNLGLIGDNFRVFFTSDLASSGYTPSCFYNIEFQGKVFEAASRSWKTNTSGMQNLIKSDRIMASGKLPTFIKYFDDFPAQEIHNMWNDTHGASDLIYVVQTSNKVIQRCILMSSDPGDLILDPTCGGGTTATVAEQWGRRWITIDTSRVALALARSRLMGARYPFYILADTPEGQIKRAELTRTAPSSKSVHGNIRHGFVYERVPHITLGSIARDTEIEFIWSKWQKILEPISSGFNKLIGKTLKEWEIPRDLDLNWPLDAQRLHADWWQSRLARQKEIDSRIAAEAEFENLFDKPYEDKKKVRVAGPFTVESLSPHRVLGVDENEELVDHLKEDSNSYNAKKTFPEIILENLKSSGVQQAHKEDKINFITLEPWVGKGLICAKGTYLEGTEEKTAGILIGPEFGTVQRADLVAAARECGDAGFDVLISCAFNYEAHATEFSNLGKIPVLKARMNADLHMAEDLKNTGKGNLFVIFGEPDITILPEKDGRLRLKVNGVDVFKPQTGEVVSDNADGIACWFIDTDYNEESFFVRHAYFLGANDPYNSLKTTLKAEINKEAWETLNSDTSRPFEKPKSGRIAVKVINHLGDEVMKVFRV